MSHPYDSSSFDPTSSTPEITPVAADFTTSTPDIDDDLTEVESDRIPARTPNPAGPQFIRRLFLDALFELDWSHDLCHCWSCSRVRRMLDLLGFTVEKWNPNDALQLTSKHDDTRFDCLVLGILIREVWLYAHTEGQPLESILEVPSNIGELLWEDGWGPILLASQEYRDHGRRLKDQPLWIRSARRQLIEELAKLALPDDQLRHLDPSESVELGRSLDEDQSERAIAFHTESFERWGIACPRIPSSVVPHLRLDENRLGIETSGVPIGAVSGYDLGQLRRHTYVPFDYLHPDCPNYFVASGRGNEGGSYWGLAARGGRMFASVQVQIGSFVAEMTSPASRIIEAYNELVFPHLDRRNQEVEVAVCFSRFRKAAYVVARGLFELETMNPLRPIPPFWSWVLDLSDVRHDDIDEVERRVDSARTRAGGRENVLAAIEFVRRAHLA